MATVPRRPKPRQASDADDDDDRSGPAPAPVKPTRTLWEYEEVFLRHDHEWPKTLNTMGEKGWELVGMVHDESETDPEALQVRCVFKRPRREDADAEQDGE